MNIYLTNESYKASTQLVQQLPPRIDQVSSPRNSTAAFQILLHDGKKNHYVLDQQFSIPDAIDIPIYRIDIQSELPVEAYFVEYYYGSDDWQFADKLLEEKSHTYSGDRYGVVYAEIPLESQVKSGSYDITVNVYRAGIATGEKLIEQAQLTLVVNEFTFPKDVTSEFDLDIWQQPSNLARTFGVTPWSNEHFQLVAKMAQQLAKIGQKSITVIAGEIPWKGWFNYIVKDYPANLYEYSMVKVTKNKAGELSCDFQHLDRYLQCFFDAGITDEIEVFGLLGVWQPPFFPLVKHLDYPEKLVIRYFDEDSGTFQFIEDREELKNYFSLLFAHFKEKNLWEKVRIAADEPKMHEIEKFKASLAELKTVDETVQLKVAFDKEPVLEALLPDVAYPVTSYYTTCKNHERLNTENPGRTQYYICNYPDRPNMFLNSPLLESRLQGTLAFHFKMDGMLRWAYNCWPTNAREDIRYNTTNLPIGDLCLVYPSVSGTILLSLRYKQLYRGLEDFYLLKTAAKTDETATQKILDEFLVTPDTKTWMLDSHTGNPELFQQTTADFESLREQLIAIITG